MQFSAKKLLDKTEACELLRIKHRRLDYFRKAGQLAFVKIGGRVFFLPADIEQFIRARRIPSTK
jgi:hypothetical protein